MYCNPDNDKIQRNVLHSCACALLLLFSNVQAGISQSEIEKITANWQCKWCPSEKEPHSKGTVEAGAGSVSNDSLKHGNYTGLDEQGAFFVGNASYEYRGNDSGYADIKARDIGLDSRQLEAKGGKQGQYDVELRYASIPRLNSDTARTPYRGKGRQSLPAGWVTGASTVNMTELANSLRDVDIYTERKTLDVGATYNASPSLSYELNYQQQTKQGRKTMGLALGSTFVTARSAILAVPVDTSTKQGTIKAIYRTQKWQASLGYNFSNFVNEHERIYWENAYSNPAVPAGQAALEPENGMQQLTFEGAYDFSTDTRALFSVAAGQSKQDADFLPYTINGASPSLPRSSLDGKVNTFNTTMRLNTRWKEVWGFSAQYRHNEQANDTPRAAYNYVIADTAPSLTARTNLPYSFRERELSLQGRYQIDKQRHIKLDYAKTRNDRTYQAVESSDEDALSATYRSDVNKQLQWFLRISASNRDGDEYVPVTEITPPENTLLRKYNLADRMRNSAALSVTYSFTDALQLSAFADLANDDYSNSDIGLQESRQSTYSLELQYRVNKALNMNFDYSVTGIESTQAGTSWSADNEDRINVSHFGVNYDLNKYKLLLGADFAFVNSIGDVTVSTGDGFPALKSIRKTFSLFADYSLNEKSVIHTFIGYEDYDEEDWATSDVVPNTLSSVLSLGEESPSYGIGFFAISYKTQF